MVSQRSAYFCLLRRDLLLGFRQPVDTIVPLLFFIVIVALFPLGIQPQSSLLHNIAAGIIWISALLVHLLALERLFHHDFVDGSLEQLLLSPHPLSVLVSAKLIAHWLMTGLPLVLVSPLLALLLQLSWPETKVLIISLALGTPVLTFIGAIGAALTVGLRGRGVLLALLVLPLYIPVLIFAAGSVHNVAIGLSATGALALLGAILALVVPLAPLAIAAALRVGVNE